MQKHPYGLCARMQAHRTKVREFRPTNFIREIRTEQAHSPRLQRTQRINFHEPHNDYNARTHTK